MMIIMPVWMHFSESVPGGDRSLNLCESIQNCSRPSVDSGKRPSSRW